MNWETAGKLFGALGGTAIIAALYRRYKRPKLIAVVHVAPQENTPKPTGDGYWKYSTWVRLIVTNAGNRHVALNVEPSLIGVQQIHSDGSVTHHLVGADVRRVAWQNDWYKIKAKDLQPSVPCGIDVAYTNDEAVGLFTTANPPLIFDKPGIYRFAVLVTSDNLPPVTEYLSVEWDGSSWSAVTARQLSKGAWA